MPDQPKLNRTLTLPLVALYGLGVTVGAGIYVLIGETASLAGAHVPAAFVIAALVVSFTAFSYAELTTRMPVSAGEAAYVEAGLNSVWLGRLAGLAVAVSGVVSAAAVAIGAGGYLAGLTGWPAPLLTAGVVLTMGLIAWWGITQSVAIAATITVIELLGLGWVVFWGFGVVEPAGVSLGEMIPPLSGPHWAGIGAASLLAFFAFIGFEDMVNVAEEVKDPRHTLPRAITITLVVATLLYVAVATAVLFAVPVEELAGSQAPLMLVFRDEPPVFQMGFAAVATVATVNGVLIQIVMASRVVYGMADRGQLPAVLARVSQVTHTPSSATMLVVGTIFVLSSFFPIGDLAGGTSQIVLSVFVLVNLSLAALKLRNMAPGDAFVVPVIVPILGAASSIALLVTPLL